MKSTVEAGGRRSRLIAVLVLAGILPLAGGVEWREPTRWAVIVGVSDYLHFGESGALPGASADARALRDVLVTRWAFPPDNVRLLLDADATREGIEVAMTQWLRSVAQPGDVVLFYFSGHGSQAWDIDGDEEDGLDETIAPHDALPGSTENDIIDDELGRWLTALRTDNVVAILDNCHAGTGTRAVVANSRPRLLARDVSALPRPAQSRGAERNRSESTRLFGPGVLELAAAQADQIAVEIAWPQEDGGTVWGGAFTTMLVKQLWTAPAGTTYEDVFRATQNEMRRLGFTQDPRISADGASLPFLGLAAPPLARERRPAWVVEAASVDGVALTPLAGLWPGAILQAEGVLLRITRAGAAGAHAEPVREEAPPAAGADAVLLAVPPPSGGVRVELTGLDAGTRAALLSALEIAESIPDGASAGPGDLILRSVAGGVDVIGMDGAVRHGLRGTMPRVAELLTIALRREADARQIALLDNPAEPFPLSVMMTGGRSVLALGDPVELRVQSGRDGHLTLIDLGTDGTLTVLYPGGAASEGRISAGVPIVIPTAAMRAAGEAFTAVPPAGAGMLRAFVTPAPLDLPQDGTPVSAAAVLRSLLDAVTNDETARTLSGAGAGLLLPLRGWSTAVLHYRISR